MSEDDPIVGRAQMPGFFPPGVPETIMLELRESGTVTWRPWTKATTPPKLVRK